jgi:hypothetical protein
MQIKDFFNTKMGTQEIKTANSDIFLIILLTKIITEIIFREFNATLQRVHFQGFLSFPMKSKTTAGQIHGAMFTVTFVGFPFKNSQHF